MKEFEFTLILDPSIEITDDVLDKLYSKLNDCSYSQRGSTISLNFERTAASFDEAILLAIKEVCSIGLKVRRVDVCSLVTQAEIARRSNLTRQAINNYVIGKRGEGFPAPVCNLHDDHNAPLWNWCEVAQWLSERQLLSSEVTDEAFGLDIINTHLERLYQKNARPGILSKIEASFEDCESCS